MTITPQASEPLEKVVRPTTFIESRRLSRHLGIDLVLASETFQHTGSFKFRAAYNLASTVPHHEIITASSGNFGQALAYSCSLLGKQCTIVMPATSAQVKIDAVRDFGGIVDLTDVRVKGRNERLAEVAREKPLAFAASPYDDPLVIQGNASLGREICQSGRDFDFIVAPVGGGGLSSGIIKGVRQSGKDARIKIVGAEPLIANDAARSLREGRLIKNDFEPMTIADGARTPSLGQHNWQILREGISDIVEVPEDKIKEAVRLLFAAANLKAEPTGALGLAAVMTKPEIFRGHSVCCVVSGGNVDSAVYSELLAG
ncbi:MAG TPA: threonine/serine dehydratase [Blastocatellia bacterium]|nr:threonine/serine dehydratase [Blastocatellia bacterium]